MGISFCPFQINVVSNLACVFDKTVINLFERYACKLLIVIVDIFSKRKQRSLVCIENVNIYSKKATLFRYCGNASNYH